MAIARSMSVVVRSIRGEDDAGGAAEEALSLWIPGWLPAGPWVGLPHCAHCDARSTFNTILAGCRLLRLRCISPGSCRIDAATGIAFDWRSGGSGIHLSCSWQPVGDVAFQSRVAENLNSGSNPKKKKKEKRKKEEKKRKKEEKKKKGKKEEEKLRLLATLSFPLAQPSLRRCLKISQIFSTPPPRSHRLFITNTFPFRLPTITSTGSMKTMLRSKSLAPVARLHSSRTISSSSSPSSSSRAAALAKAAQASATASGRLSARGPPTMGPSYNSRQKVTSFDAPHHLLSGHDEASAQYNLSSSQARRSRAARFGTSRHATYASPLLQTAASDQTHRTAEENELEDEEQLGLTPRLTTT